MLRGIYTAASGMTNVQLATDTLANNIANVNTTAYKARYVQYQAYPEIAMSRVDSSGTAEVGKLTTGVEIVGTPLHISQGALQPTANPMDVAIDGDGFFAVELPNGEIGYTRNGKLKLNQANELVVDGGVKILDANGSPIVVQPDYRKLTITEDGTLHTEAGQAFARLKLVRFSNPKGLQAQGDSIYRGENPVDIPPGQGGAIMQGYIERSNTNVVHEMIQSISGMRLYESLQKSINTQSGTLGKAINELR